MIEEGICPKCGEKLEYGETLQCNYTYCTNPECDFWWDDMY